MSQGKLIYIFVAGVEGVGHHGLNPLLTRALQNSSMLQQSNGEVVRNKRRLKRILNWYWCRSHPLGFTRPLVRAMINRFFRQERLKMLRNDQVRVVLEDNSFPAGKNRDLNKAWNLLEMKQIVSEYADEVYFIGLYRDPIAATFSHPGFDLGMFAHAEVLKQSLIYLNGQMQQLSTTKKLFLRYEDLSLGQQGLAPVLSEFLGIEADALNSGFAEIRASKKNWREQMAADDQEKMLAIFSDEEAQQHWPLFANCPRYQQ